MSPKMFSRSLKSLSDEDALHFKCSLSKGDLSDALNGGISEKAGASKFKPILPLDHPDRTELILSVEDNIKWLMSIDRKATALKAFQGFMWKSAYEKGTVKGQVYVDVVENVKKWHARDSPNNISLYIYSSGSIAAQKLLFQYSDHGDLLPYINGHFDTMIGAKSDAKSYKNISKEIKLDPSQILFLSDNPKEIEAALEAGFQVGLASRPGNAVVPQEQYELQILNGGLEFHTFNVVKEGIRSIETNEDPNKKDQVLVPKINSFHENF